MTALHKRLFALWTVLVALLPLSTSAGERYLCRMTSRVVDVCCCGRATVVPRSETRVQSPDCCVRLSSQTPVAAPARREIVDQNLDATPLVAVLEKHAGVPARGGHALEAALRSAPGVSLARHRLFLENCALLI